VPSERADRAYAWQVAAVRQFLSGVLPSGTAVIVGGDFNTGNAAARMAAVSRPLVDAIPVDGLRTVLTKGRVIPGSQDEARRIIGRNKDRILAHDGARVALRPERAWVPFPITARAPLSDHAGFVIDFSFERRSTRSPGRRDAAGT
jgi:endonuclease/exonuclease/phosphatase (EEP) superfamily protein YafD